MQYVSIILTGVESVKIEQVVRQWPGQLLSRAEMTRRLALSDTVLVGIVQHYVRIALDRTSD